MIQRNRPVGWRKEQRARRRFEKWLDDDYNWFERRAQGLLAIFHNKFPRRFRPFPALHWTWKTALACSAPYLAALYGTIAWSLAATAAGVLFLGNVVTEFLARMAEPARTSSHETSTVIRLGDVLSALRKRAPAEKENVDMAIGACLGIIENFCRAITKADTGEISVTLLTYSKDKTHLLVYKRDPGNKRPIGREVDAKAFIGHYVCERGMTSHAVHDNRRFPKEMKQSPTQTATNYRSLFIVPLDNGRQVRGRVEGFISIDCSRPYSFYGNRSRMIIVTCQPNFDQVAGLL